MSTIIPIPRHEALKRHIRTIPNLVGYYPLDELSGNAINYAPANQGLFNGTVNGATQGSVPPSSGFLGRSYISDGVNDNVNMGNNYNYQVGQSGQTIGFLGYVYNNNSGTGRDNLIFISQEATDFFGTQIMVSHKSATFGNGRFRFGYQTTASYSTSREIRSTVSIIGTIPKLYTFVYKKGSYARIYINNVMNAETTINVSHDINPNAGANYYLFSGTLTASDQFASARMQHNFIVRRALEPQEITRICQIAGLTS